LIDPGYPGADDDYLVIQTGPVDHVLLRQLFLSCLATCPARARTSTR
jgi:hypothetical protein